MKTALGNDVDDVSAIVASLARDEVVAIPTDTVYGLAANPASELAMRRLFALKQRPEGVPVAVLAATSEMAQGLVRPSQTFDALAEEHWPGALTIVAESRAGLDFHIGSARTDSGVETLGVRVPDHDLIQRASRLFGPIAATSANVHGSPTITDPHELVDVFGPKVELIIDGGVLEGLASTVVDVTGTEVIVLRPGVVHIA